MEDTTPVHPQPTRSFFDFIVYFFVVLFRGNNESDTRCDSEEEEVLSSSYQNPTPPCDKGKKVMSTTFSSTTTTTQTTFESREFRIEISSSTSSFASTIPNCCGCTCFRKCCLIPRPVPDSFDTFCCILCLIPICCTTGFNPIEAEKYSYFCFQLAFLVKAIFDFPFKHPFLFLFSISNTIAFSVSYSYYPFETLQISLTLNSLLTIFYALYRVLSHGHSNYHRYSFPDDDDPQVPSHPADLSKWDNLNCLIKCFRRVFRKCLCESVNYSLGCCLCCYKSYHENELFTSSVVSDKHPFYRRA